MDIDESNRIAFIRFETPLLKVLIDDQHFFGLFDTCSKFTLAGRPLIRYLQLRNQMTVRTPQGDARILCKPGPLLRPREEAQILFHWAQGSIRHRLIFVPELMCELILGRDFMRHTDIMIHPKRFGWSFGYHPTRVFSFDQECDCCVHLPSWRLMIREYSPPRDDVAAPAEGGSNESIQLAGDQPNEVIASVDLNVQEAPADYRVVRDWHTPTSHDEVVPGNEQQGIQGEPTVDADEAITNGVVQDPNDLLRLRASAVLSQINAIYDILDDGKASYEKRSAYNRRVQELVIEFRRINRDLGNYQYNN